MRVYCFGVLAATMLMSGCDNAAVAPAATSSADAMRQAVAQKAERKAADPAPAAVRTSLSTPLPGGVTPNLDFTVGSDTSMKLRHSQRILMLVARGTTSKDALEVLAGQFAAAGFESGSMSSDDESLMQRFWTSGEVRGMEVVEAGGTHIYVMVRNVDADSDFAKEGYSTFIMVTVTSP